MYHDAIKLFGFCHNQGETLEEFGESVGHSLPWEAIEFLPYYENMIYGDVPVSQQMLACALKSRECLLICLKREKGIFFRLRYYREIIL